MRHNDEYVVICFKIRIFALRQTSADAEGGGGDVL